PASSRTSTWNSGRSGVERMSQDKPDDPLAPRDVTILRPRPGVGRKPPPTPQAPPPVQPAAQATPPASYAPAPPPAQPPAQFATPAYAAESLPQLPGVAVNPLVQ